MQPQNDREYAIHLAKIKARRVKRMLRRGKTVKLDSTSANLSNVQDSVMSLDYAKSLVEAPDVDAHIAELSRITNPTPAQVQRLARLIAQKKQQKRNVVKCDVDTTGDPLVETGLSKELLNRAFVSAADKTKATKDMVLKVKKAKQGVFFNSSAKHAKSNSTVKTEKAILKCSGNADYDAIKKIHAATGSYGIQGKDITLWSGGRAVAWNTFTNKHHSINKDGVVGTHESK